MHGAGVLGRGPAGGGGGGGGGGAGGGFGDLHLGSHLGEVGQRVVDLTLAVLQLAARAGTDQRNVVAFNDRLRPH